MIPQMNFVTTTNRTTANITIPLCILVVVLSSVDKPVLVGGTLAATSYV